MQQFRHVPTLDISTAHARIFSPAPHMADLNEHVERQALQPIASSAGQQSATGRSIDDLIKAAQHKAAVAAQGMAHQGAFHVQMIPAGAGGSGSGSQAFNNAGGL